MHPTTHEHMSHKYTLLAAALVLGTVLHAQQPVSFIGQLLADSSFQGAMVQVSQNGRVTGHVPVPQDGRFTVNIPEETVAELVVFSDTHLKESIIIDTHHAFCDPVTTPLNSRFKMQMALFPRSIAGDLKFNKPYGKIYFVAGTGRRVFEHNMIEVESPTGSDYADNVEDR